MRQHRGIFKKNKKTGRFELIPECPKPEHHYVITDETDPFISPASYNKRVFTSKSAHDRYLKSKGYEVTGGDHLLKRKEGESDAAYAKRCDDYSLRGGLSESEYEKKMEREVREDVERAYFDVKYGRVHFNEQEKELHLREKRRLGKSWALKAPY